MFFPKDFAGKVMASEDYVLGLSEEEMKDSVSLQSTLEFAFLIAEGLNQEITIQTKGCEIPESLSVLIEEFNTKIRSNLPKP